MKHVDGIKTSTDLFGAHRFIPRKGKTERGELLAYFAHKLGWEISRVAWKVEGLSVQDLYFIKSAADLYERDGHPWGKAFSGMLKVK